MPSRRDVLGLGGATVAVLAGCLGRSAPVVETTESPSESSPPTTEPTPTADVRLREVTVTPSVVALNSPDSIGTYGASDSQFVVVAVGARERLPFDRGAFSLTTDEETYDPTTPRDVTGQYSLWGFDDPYEPGPGGYLLFEVPKPLDADRATLRWPNGEHRLGDDHVRRLARRPTSFEVREFSAPDSVTTYTEATLTLTVENVDSADGTFVAGLNRVGPEIAYAPVESVSFDVAAGESETWTHAYTPTVPAPDEDLSFEFVMNWRGDDERAEIGVEPGE